MSDFTERHLSTSKDWDDGAKAVMQFMWFKGERRFCEMLYREVIIHLLPDETARKAFIAECCDRYGPLVSPDTSAAPSTDRIEPTGNGGDGGSKVLNPVPLPRKPSPSAAMFPQLNGR